jgi:hypothetical protein
MLGVGSVTTPSLFSQPIRLQSNSQTKAAIAYKTIANWDILEAGLCEVEEISMSGDASGICYLANCWHKL